jgi:hypothetical protein
MKKTTVLMAAVLAVSTVLTAGLAVLPSYATSDDPASKGLEIADQKVHENTGPVSDQDIKFHEGLCQGGHTTKALEALGGCDILSAPGNSDDHRNDD